jgi:hypothetical protein
LTINLLAKSLVEIGGLGVWNVDEVTIDQRPKGDLQVSDMWPGIARGDRRNDLIHRADPQDESGCPFSGRSNRSGQPADDPVERDA